MGQGVRGRALWPCQVLPDSPVPTGGIGRPPTRAGGLVLPGTPAHTRERRKGLHAGPEQEGEQRVRSEPGPRPRRPHDPAAPAPGLAPPRGRGRRGPGRGRRALPGPAGERRPAAIPGLSCARSPRPYRLHGVLQDGGELGEHPVPGLQQPLPGRPGELLDPPPPPLLRLPGPLQSEGRCGAGRTSRGPRRARPGRFGCARAARRLRRALRRGGR